MYLLICRSTYPNVYWASFLVYALSLTFLKLILFPSHSNSYFIPMCYLSDLELHNISVISNCIKLFLAPLFNYCKQF